MDESRSSVLRDVTPVLILLALAIAICAYFVAVDDYVADTGPILDRGLGCLFGFAAAITIGSAIATVRAATHPFGRGLQAGSLGAFCLAAVLVVLTGFENAVDLTAFVGVGGSVAAAFGALIGLILRGP